MNSNAVRVQGVAANDLRKDTVIRSIKSIIIDAPTLRKHKLSNTEISHQGYVHVSVLLENGVIGYGEGSTLGGPRWAEESVEAIKTNIDTYLAPALLGQSACNSEHMSVLMSKAAKRNFSAKCALDSAMLDAVGKSLNVHASNLLGGTVRDRFSVIWALASGEVEQEIEEAKEKISRREFNRFKIKIGFSNPSQDIERLQRLRTALGNDIEMIVDVNQAWSEAQCIRWLPAFEEMGIALIEQPVPSGQIETMARIAARSQIPLMLDEAVFTIDETFRSMANGAGSVLSLKLVKSGGVHQLKRTAGIAQAAGVELYGGCLLESSLGAAAHLAVFAGLPALEWGTEHFGPRILVNDLVTNPLVYEDFHVLLPKGPGLGVTPDLEQIKAFARKD